jgi:hypothetical protein
VGFAVDFQLDCLRARTEAFRDSFVARSFFSFRSVDSYETRGGRDRASAFDE